MSDNLEMLTIGHSSHQIDRFVELLSLHRVTVVVDVRSVPYSRACPQFNRESLAKALKERGIGYVFLGAELGARPKDKACYENGRVQYDRLAKTDAFRNGLARLCSLARRYRVAIMCSEREPLQCHRTLLVARELAKMDVSVAHIHADGRLEVHQDAMRRLLEVLRMPETDLFHSQAELIEMASARQAEHIAYAQKRLGSTGQSER